MARLHLRIPLRFRRTKIYSPGMNKPALNRLNWEQIEARHTREGRNVVKGTNKRVVVVKSPDPKIFEQAIFIVREDFSQSSGKVNVLQEAERVANDYISAAVGTTGKLLRKLPPWAFAAAGAVLSVLVLLVLRFFGI